MVLNFLDIPVQKNDAVVFEQSNLLSFLLFPLSSNVRLMVYDYGDKSYVSGLQSATFTRVGDHFWCDLTSQNYSSVISELANNCAITMGTQDFINHVSAFVQGYFNM